MGKALVVDDESDSRDFVRAILEDEGWEVHEAADGAAGLDQAISLKPQLVVLDVSMPKMDGFNVFGQLVAKHGEIVKDSKFVMLTGVGKKHGMSFGANDMGKFYGREPDAYVEKPIDPETFKGIIQKVAPKS